MNLAVDGKVCFNGLICYNNQDVVQFSRFGFKGQLKFIDTQGNESPNYTGYGERWFLVYVHE